MRLGSSWHTRCDLRRPYVSKLSARMKAPSGRVRLAGHRPTFRTSWPIIRSRLPRTYPEQSLQDKTVCYRIDVTVVERTEVAAAASGKAGGFLALDWCVGTPLDALARRSFLLHAELPNVVAGDWGYRGMTAYSGFVVPEGDARRHAAAKLTWLSDGVIIASRLSTTDTTAIVHPRAFTAAMMSAAQGHGAELRHGRVTGIVRRADGSTVRGVEVDGGVIELDAVVVAMGPWSQMAAEWMVLPAVFGLRSPSLVYNTGMDVPADALFLEYHERTGGVLTVEVFPRANGNTLVTAFSDEAPLPLDPAAVTPDRNEVDRLKVICERVSPAFQAENIIAGQACFRPVTQDGSVDRQGATDRGRLRGHRP